MAKSKAKDEAAPVSANKPPLPRWKVSGIYGHAERVLEAADEEAAWQEYMRLDGLLSSEHRPVIQRVREG